MKRFEDLNRIEKKSKKSRSRRKKRRSILPGIGIAAAAIAVLFCLCKALIFPNIPALDASTPTVAAAQPAPDDAVQSESGNAMPSETGEGAEDQRQVYENEYIRLEVPASWTRIDGGEGSDVLTADFYANGEGKIDGGFLMVLVSRSTDAQSNYEFYQEYVNTIVAGLQNKDTVDQEITPITINDRRGYTFDFDMNASITVT